MTTINPQWIETGTDALMACLYGGDLDGAETGDAYDDQRAMHREQVTDVLTAVVPLITGNTHDTTLTITVGLPGSGKSTWAKQQPGVRVNRDDLRAMLVAGPWPHGDRAAEDMCTVAQHAQISALLGAGIDVICDDTNLRPDVVRALTDLAERAGAVVRVVDLTGVPVEECIRRDALRPEGERVGADRIQAMWDRYVADLAVR